MSWDDIEKVRKEREERQSKGKRKALVQSSTPKTQGFLPVENWDFDDDEHIGSASEYLDRQ